MIIISKIFATILAVLVIARSFSDFKQKKEGVVMTVFWVSIWSIVLILAYYPILIEIGFKLLNFERTGLGKLYAMGMIFLLFVVYRVYVKANRIEKQVEEIARKTALKDLKRR